MKSLAELQAIRDKARASVNIRENAAAETRVLVGMATCGIAAGARPVMTAFLDEINRRGLTNVTVSQTGCIGVCRLEPVAEVFVPGEEKVTYVRLRPEMIPAIVEQHLVNHNVVQDYTIGAAE